jgi:hypothetical protein
MAADWYGGSDQQIVVTFHSIDGYTEQRKYKTLRGARRWVDEMLGDNYELGGNYAVSYDGVGIIQAQIHYKGIVNDKHCLRELLNEEE